MAEAPPPSPRLLPTLEREDAAVAPVRLHGEDRVVLLRERWRLKGELPLVLTRSVDPATPRRGAVLLVHGFAQNRVTWHTSVRSFSGWLAARGWEVWNLELRGHGLSREAGRGGAERFHDYVEDVVAAVRALPDRPFLMGHSLGGAAVYGAATELDQDNAPMGIVGLAGLYGFGLGNPLIRLACEATHRLSQVPVLGGIQVKSRLIGRVMGRLYNVTDLAGYTVPLSGWWPGSVEPELLEERLEHGFDWTSLKVWQEMARWAAEQRFDYDDAWARTDVPLLVALGDKDHLLPPEDGRLAYERSGSSDKELVVFDDWQHGTHWGHLDIVLGTAAPREVWPVVHRWMAERA